MTIRHLRIIEVQSWKPGRTDGYRMELKRISCHCMRVIPVCSLHHSDSCDVPAAQNLQAYYDSGQCIWLSPTGIRWIWRPAIRHDRHRNLVYIQVLNFIRHLKKLLLQKTHGSCSLFWFCPDTIILCLDTMLFSLFSKRSQGSSEFSTRLRRSDVNVRPLDHVDGFTCQEVRDRRPYDALASFKMRTKRRRKAVG